MKLTPLGAQVTTMGAPEQKKHGLKLVSGSVNINKYTNGVCYDAAALVRCLLGTKIKPADVESKSGQSWRTKFGFTTGKKWDGKTSIKAGSAVGFYRLRDKQVFHAAIATGGTRVRAVNGGKLGAGWQAVDLKKVLGAADDDGAFEYDRTKIEVWVSKT